MKVVKFWKLVWTYYQAEKESDTLIIVAIWAPNLMDVDNLRNANILTNLWYDVISPEYYGFCRSEGRFTPKNSIKTLIDTKNFFKSWVLKSVYSWENIKVSYKNFIFLGMSYGWWVVPLLPKYDKEIKNIAMFYPVTDYSSFWKRWVKEETVEDFCNSIYRWFSKIYRSINLTIWKKQFSDSTPYIPIKNIKYLENSNIFLAHGTLDKSIYYKKTSEYYEKIKKEFPDINIVYKEYSWAWHWVDTMFPATYEMIDFFENIERSEKLAFRKILKW